METTSTQQNWNRAHPEKMREATRRYRLKNPEKTRAACRRWYAQNKQRGILASTRWAKAHPEKRVLYRLRGRETSRKYENNLYKNDICYRLAKVLRCRLADKLRKYIKGSKKKEVSAVKYLGCSLGELKIHIESLFQPGMTWDNWSLVGWHIDHTNPFAVFDLSDEGQIAKVCHYTNLKPMWAPENLKKGGKSDYIPESPAVL